MKVYSDVLRYNDLVEALPPGVDIAVVETIPRPRKRTNGWIISLTVSSPYASAFSGFGSSRHKAATWTEHGIWMAKLYELDPNACIAFYAGLEDFLRQTRDFVESYRRYHGGADRPGYEAPWLLVGTSHARL